MFELSNEQRKYFGIAPIGKDWLRKELPADRYRPPSLLYFEGNALKRQITSTEFEYKEIQLEESTRDKEIFLPKTAKGKEQKITPSTLESKTAVDTYCVITNHGRILIANFSNQRTFYDSTWERLQNQDEAPISDWVNSFISASPSNHLTEITDSITAKRKHCKFRAGNYFRFKLNRTEFGFGRVLLDINKIRKKNLIEKNHGLFYLMGTAVLIKLYAIRTTDPEFDLTRLNQAISIPSDYIMDNKLFYGDYEIVGHKALVEEDFDFPISYGKSISYGATNVFLQWGLIHLELPLTKFNKYIQGEVTHFAPNNPNRNIQNPYGYYSIGFSPRSDSCSIYETLADGYFSYEKSVHFKSRFDLRDSKHRNIKSEIFNAFGLKESMTYFEAARKTNSLNVIDVIDQL